MMGGDYGPGTSPDLAETPNEAAGYGVELQVEKQRLEG
jgi:hypothetical protein